MADFGNSITGGIGAGAGLPAAGEDGALLVSKDGEWETGADKDVKVNTLEAAGQAAAANMLAGALGATSEDGTKGTDVLPESSSTSDTEAYSGLGSAVGQTATGFFSRKGAEQKEFGHDAVASLADAEIAGKLLSVAQLSAILNGAFHPTYYHVSGNWTAKPVTVAADRHTLLGPVTGALKVGSMDLSWDSQPTLDLSTSASWDTTAGTDYTVALNRRGLDFYIYACQPVSGNTPVWKISVNSTVPTGYAADTSRKVGGFHCLVWSVGTIASHWLTGYITGDVLPYSVWDLLNRASGQQAGHVYSAASNRWGGIYLPSGTGANTRSAANATISDTRNWMDFVDDGAAIGDKLYRDAEFQVDAEGSNQQTNIYGSQDPVKTSDIGTKLITGATLNSLSFSRVAFSNATGTLEIELEIDANGTPDTFKWRWRTFAGSITSWSSYTSGVAITGAAQTIIDGITVTFPGTTGFTIGHKANIYIMNAGFDTAGRRMISNFGHEMMCGAMDQFLDISSFRFSGAANHTHTVTGDPGNTGNPSGDVAPAYAHVSASPKGSFTTQGTTGERKASGGGYFSVSTLAGSRRINLFDYSRSTNSANVSARFCSPPRITNFGL